MRALTQQAWFRTDNIYIEEFQKEAVKTIKEYFALFTKNIMAKKSAK